jgi:hypothetical protein
MGETFLGYVSADMQLESFSGEEKRPTGQMQFSHFGKRGMDNGVHPTGQVDKQKSCQIDRQDGVETTGILS